MAVLSLRDTHVVFATNHHKSPAAVEPFRRLLNTSVEELIIDSDQLGTFSGEVDRPGSMLDALRGKVRLARTVSSARFVLVSEGSFGGAGGFGFLAQGIEMLLLHDSVTGAEVLEQYISWDTNYATATISTEQDLKRFLERISFGTHGLVLYPQGLPPAEKIVKGIMSQSEADKAFSECLQASPTGAVVVMSDMRAHRNPTRMKAIAACCELLAHRLATPCPTCGSGGFGLVSTVPGLPCGACGFPTERARAEKHACPVCGASKEKPRGDGKTKADPVECERCNP
jgi:hypothetical protein